MLAFFFFIGPSVHGGSKTLVSYIGDFIVIKCDTSTYKPLKWLWYKVTENEQVNYDPLHSNCCISPG